MKGAIFISNIQDLTPKHKNEHPQYEYTKYEVTPRKDFSQCYVAVYEIPPQKASYPYHCHLANTETFYILRGQGCFVTPEGAHAVRAGDFIVCPPGEAGSHLIKNTSATELLQYIDFDTTNSPDIIRYPDSGKTGIVLHNESSTYFKDQDAVNYYDGE